MQTALQNRIEAHLGPGNSLGETGLGSGQVNGAGLSEPQLVDFTDLQRVEGCCFLALP